MTANLDGKKTYVIVFYKLSRLQIFSGMFTGSEQKEGQSSLLGQFVSDDFIKVEKNKTELETIRVLKLFN